MQSPQAPSLRDHVFATIQAGRALLGQIEASTLHFAHHRDVTALMDHLDKANFFDPADEAVLQDIVSQACACIGTCYPTWTDALAEGRLPESSFGDPDAEGARRLLEATLDFRRIRRRVLDEVLADRLAFDLQRRR